jgi:hypothetical protein
MFSLKVPSSRGGSTGPAPTPAKKSGSAGAWTPVVRRHDRTRFVVGVAVTAGCALLFGALAIVTGHRRQVRALARLVAAGQALTGAHLTSVLTPVDPDTAIIGTSRKESAVGRCVTALLSAGSLLCDGLRSQGPAMPGSVVMPPLGGQSAGGARRWG